MDEHQKISEHNEHVRRICRNANRAILSALMRGETHRAIIASDRTERYIRKRFIIDEAQR